MSDDQPSEFVRRSDLMAMGFTRTDAERIMRATGAIYRPGKAVYVRREDALRAIAATQVKQS